jgi:hypothetical protein
MAAEDVINTAYLSTLGRPADPEGLAFYSAQLEAGRSVGEILADLNFAVESGIENVEANRQANATQNLTPQIQAARDASAGGGDNLPTVNLPVVNAPQLERNPVYPTLQVREDVNYDQLFGAKPLDQGGTAPTPEAINRAFETFYNRPADTAGIQGYLQSGKSMEQINADLAYQSLYAPELGLAQNAQYYEAPSQAQLGYIQSLGGGTPTFEREDTFTYTTPDPLTAEEVTSIYRDQFGYDPTPQDLEYYTQVYAMSPDVRYSANPRQQTINAILAGSGLPQYEYLKKDTDLTGTQGVNYKGTAINPTQLANQRYSDYRGAPPTQPAAPFGGFFGDDNFNPFDYTGIAPTPTYIEATIQRLLNVAAEVNMLGNQYLGGNFEPQGMEFYSTQRSTGRSLADIAADLSASPEGQAFAQTRVPSPERAAISSSRSFAARSPTEAAETLRALDPTLRTANLADQGIVAALRIDRFHELNDPIR